MSAAALMIWAVVVANAAFQRHETLLIGKVGRATVHVVIVKRGSEVLGAIYRPEQGDTWDAPVHNVHLLTPTPGNDHLRFDEWGDNGQKAGSISVASLRNQQFNESPLTNTALTAFPVLDRLHAAMKAGEWEQALVEARLACALPDNDCRWLDAVRDRRLPDFETSKKECAANVRVACNFYLDMIDREDETTRRVALRQICGRHLLGCEAAWGKNEVALVGAARRVDATAVRRLLDSTVNVNAGGGALLTPIQAAVVACSLPVVELLLEYGADPNNPLHESGWGIHSPFEFALMNHMEDIAERLLDYGAKAEGALWMAARNNHYAFARKLLANGIDPDDAVPAGSALMAAVESNDLLMVKLLLAHGSSPDFSTKYSGGSPITEARKRHRTAMLELLLAKKAEREREEAEREAIARRLSTILGKVHCGMTRDEVAGLGQVGGATTTYYDDHDHLMISNAEGEISFDFRDGLLWTYSVLFVNSPGSKAVICSP